MKAKLFTLIFALISAFSVFTFTATPVFADPSICNIDNVDPEVKKAAGCPGASDYDLGDSAQDILNGVIAVLGLVAVCFIVYGGFQYMTSVGDASKLQKAKHTILYAVIGLIICVLAFAIVNFIIMKILK